MKTAVLMIDLQNAYFEDPALASRQETVVEAANLLLRTATAAQVPVLLVRTEHRRDRSTWTLSMLDDDQGFIFEGTEQAAYLPGLQAEGLESIVKTRDSAFFGTDLAERFAVTGWSGWYSRASRHITVWPRRQPMRSPTTSAWSSPRTSLPRRMKNMPAPWCRSSATSTASRSWVVAR